MTFFACKRSMVSVCSVFSSASGLAAFCIFPCFLKSLLQFRETGVISQNSSCLSSLFKICMLYTVLMKKVIEGEQDKNHMLKLNCA